MKIGVIGASGYSGGELLRLLLKHSTFTLKYIAAGTQAGSLITDVHPQLIPLTGYKFEATELTRMNQCDLLFFALPHGESAKWIPQLNPEIKVVDLGADFRLASRDSWEKYYEGVHAGTWVYGLPEIPGQREKISGAHRIANPGCYATSIALAAAPALSEGLIEADDIVVVAASGTTGAGRKVSSYLLASEVMGSLSSYKFGGIHQHTPEIEETLSAVAGTPAKISFTPILAPMPRGILATVTARLIKPLDSNQVQELYREFYASEEFVTVLPGNSLPHTSAVIGSNSVLIQVAVDAHANRLIISAALDNLGKGAASQALQNANIISGLPENTGLTSIGLGA
ncbi:MAG TPA: N-acetyl-gamma-glutamyl-phosphate reductase [Candidatus Nanopelagicaceae bacterium]